MNEERKIVDINLEDIVPNRFQPRLVFDQQALNELASSIKIHGIIQPLVLKKLGEKYEIIAGERRYKAAGIAGLTKVPAIIMNLSDDESAEVAIIENVQRSDLTPIEEAKSYKKLLDKGYLTQDQLAGRLGKAQSTVANKLRLLNLDDTVQDALLKGQISERHARSLLMLKSNYDQKEMLNKIIEKRLNVRDTEIEIKKIIDKENAPAEEISLNQVDSNPASVPEPVTTPSFLVTPQENKEEPFINPFANVKPPVVEPERPINNFATEDGAGKFFTSLPSKEEQLPEVEEFNIEPTVNINDIIDFNKEEKTLAPIEPINSAENLFDTPSEKIVPEMNTSNSNNLMSAINDIRTKISELENLGFKVTTEEFDFEKIYQVIIKIDK